MKHRILYAENEWKQQRFIPVILIVAGVIFAYQGLQTKNAANFIWIGYIPIALVFGGFYYIRRGRHFLHPADDGLHVGKTFSELTIPYDLIKSVRLQPLNQVVPQPAPGSKRKPYLPPPVKASLNDNAVVLRFQGEEEELRALAKKLGSRHIFSGSAAFPVKDAETAVKTIAQHLPHGAASTGGQNLGGARRRGRKRR